MASSDKITLVYFNIRGRAELPRLIMAQGGIQYEDKRVTGDEFKAMKDDVPFGQLPAMEYNGVTYAQTFAMARMLAKKAGLAGKDLEEQFRADMIVESMGDVTSKLIGIWFEKNEDTKKEKSETFVKEWLPGFAKRLEKLLGGADYFVGGALTYADIAVADAFGPWGPIARFEGAEWKSHAPAVAKLIDRVYEQPKIKKWVETRPESKM